MASRRLSRSRIPRASLKVSTAALAGDEPTYISLENRLQTITGLRDALAAQMLDALASAEFQGKPISPAQKLVLVTLANNLVNNVNKLAAH